MEHLSIWVILAQIINFGVLIFLFYFFLGKKIVLTLEQRKEKIKAIEEADQKAKEKLDMAEKDAEALLVKTRKTAEEIKDEAEMLAKKTKEKIISNAEKEADAIIAWAKEDTERMKNTVFENLKSKIVDLSLKVNKQLFDKEWVNKDFIEKQIYSFKD